MLRANRQESPPVTYKVLRNQCAPAGAGRYRGRSTTAGSDTPLVARVGPLAATGRTASRMARA
jgi:hypothetical protein